jgi:hypothetical protein
MAVINRTRLGGGVITCLELAGLAALSAAYTGNAAQTEIKATVVKNFIYRPIYHSKLIILILAR